jgi:Xaa-Pro aminopeptidase
MRLHNVVALLVVAAGRAAAQPVVTDVFPPEEYAARRAKVFAKIVDGVAILQGTTERPGEQPLRQSNQFHYLCGVVEPRAILVLDGRTKTAELFLNARNERFVTSMYGPGLEPGEAAARTTGLDAVRVRSEFAEVVKGLGGRAVYMPFRPEVLESASAEGPIALARLNKADPWDGRGTREEAFRAKLQEAAAGVELRDLDPVLDELRAFKSAREIAVIREATRIAGLGIMEAMRDAKPGMREYELQADAEFVFKKHGSYGASYFALVATGENTYYTHYHKGTATLKKGDLVQFDYAPDFRNYQSDVTRVFPADGKFTAWQREYYGIYLKLYRALMTSIRVHATAQEILQDAVKKMDAVMAAYKFTDPRIRGAARKFVEGYRASKATGLGHGVGMEVHDVRNPAATLEPGYIFTIEPEMRIEELHMGMRFEDMILMTETGYENLSAFVPIEVKDIERLMAKGRGLSWGRSQ